METTLKEQSTTIRKIFGISASSVLMLAAFTANAVTYQASVPLVVDSTTTQTAPNIWHYNYTVTNSAQWNISAANYTAPMSDFLVPYFTDSGITNITAPTGWSYYITNFNYFNLSGAEVLWWYASDQRYEILPGSTVSFSFDSIFESVKAPYSATFDSSISPKFSSDNLVDRGDPPIPGSPNAIRAGLHPVVNEVPEPSSLALIGLGLFSLFGFRHKADKKYPVSKVT